MLHALIVAADDVILDGFDVLAPLGAHQAGDVVARVLNAVAALADEMVVISSAEFHEPGRYSAQRVVVIFYLAGFRGPTGLV